MSKYVSKNPCIDICAFGGGVCRGCGRSKAEKKHWKRLSEAERHAIWQRVLESHGSRKARHAGALRKRYGKVSQFAGKKADRTD